MTRIASFTTIARLFTKGCSMTQDMSPKDILPFLDRIAREAGTAVVSYFHGDFAIELKDVFETGIDIVTDADRKAEDIILRAISREFPGHDVLTEETLTERTGSRWLWVIDPLDGTVNFAHGIPHFAISIALSEGEAVIAGMIYDPLRNESFSVTRNGGSFLNGKGMHVSRSETLRASLIATGFPYDRATSPDNNVTEFQRVVTRVRGVRRAGAASLDFAYVACGRLDGFWELGLKPWDQAAGILLVQEAGGRISDRKGQPASIRAKSIVATNGLVHEELVAVLNGER
jgi:myo-inositol-1(or 4)-monophosphatase